MSTSLDEIAGYSFKDPALLREALSHPSLDSGVSYQRLEFLGDRVLGLVIAERLFDDHPDEQEGKLNRRYSTLVRRETLAEISKALGIHKQLIMTEGADSEGTREKISVLGDVGEAVIGAIFLDGGLEAAKAYILKYWAPYLTENVKPSKDPKTALQEWAQARGLGLPKYEIISRSGPDHLPVFKVAVEIEKAGKSDATAKSKRAAEQAAAEALLKALEGK